MAAGPSKGFWRSSRDMVAISPSLRMIHTRNAILALVTGGTGAAARRETSTPVGAGASRLDGGDGVDSVTTDDGRDGTTFVGVGQIVA